MNIVTKKVKEIIKKHCPKLQFEVDGVDKTFNYEDSYCWSIKINVDLHKYKNSEEYIDFSYEQEQEEKDLGYEDGLGSYISPELEWELSINRKIDYKPMLKELKNYIKQLNNGKY